jgi:hypothetical protein
MDYINAKRIVHTDISVKNVMIGDGKVAKIIGFFLQALWFPLPKQKQPTATI